MFGNILSNAEIMRLRKEKLLVLNPFEPKNLKLAHYKLTASSVWSPTVHGDGNVTQKAVHHFYGEEDDVFVFEPNAYHLFEVSEHIELPDGVVASFASVSDFAIRGFALVAGKLDAGYGALDNRRQKLLFGVKNLLNQENPYSREMGLAHMSLISLSGAHLLPHAFSSSDVERLAGRDPGDWAR